MVGSLERLGSGWAGPPSLRLLVFHAMVVPTLALCVGGSQRGPPPPPPPLIQSEQDQVQAA